VAGALEVLPRPIDHDVDAAEILQAADVDRRGRIIGPLLHVDARHAIKQIRRSGGHELIDLLLANGADAGQRLGRRHGVSDRRRFRCRRRRLNRALRRRRLARLSSIGRRAANGADPRWRFLRSLHRLRRYDRQRIQLHDLFRNRR
jgi:hypothetical protein